MYPFIIYVLLVAALLWAVWYGNRIYHRREAKKYLALYRYTEAWADPHDDDSEDSNTWPQSLWGNVVYHLNYGSGITDDINATYARAPLIGGSLQEMQELDKKRKKWVAREALHRLSTMSDYDLCRDDLYSLFHCIKNSGCSLEELDSSANEVLRFIAATTMCLEKVYVAYYYIEQLGVDVTKLREDHAKEGWAAIFAAGWGGRMQIGVKAAMRQL